MTFCIYEPILLNIESFIKQCSNAFTFDINSLKAMLCLSEYLNMSIDNLIVSMIYLFQSDLTISNNLITAIYLSIN